MKAKAKKTPAEQPERKKASPKKRKSPVRRQTRRKPTGKGLDEEKLSDVKEDSDADGSE